MKTHLVRTLRVTTETNSICIECTTLKIKWSEKRVKLERRGDCMKRTSTGCFHIYCSIFHAIALLTKFRELFSLVNCTWSNVGRNVVLLSNGALLRNENNNLVGSRHRIVSSVESRQWNQGRNYRKVMLYPDTRSD